MYYLRSNTKYFLQMTLNFNRYFLMIEVIKIIHFRVNFNMLIHLMHVYMQYNIFQMRIHFLSHLNKPIFFKTIVKCFNLFSKFTELKRKLNFLSIYILNELSSICFRKPI